MTFSFIDPGFESMDSFRTHLDAYLNLFTKLQSLNFHYIATRDTNFSELRKYSMGRSRGFGTPTARLDFSITSIRGEPGTRRITTN